MHQVVRYAHFDAQKDARALCKAIDGLTGTEAMAMLGIESVNHVGIRVKDKSRSVSFYENLGFQLILRKKGSVSIFLIKNRDRDIIENVNSTPTPFSYASKTK